MKKLVLILVMGAAMLLTGCGSEKKQVVTQPVENTIKETIIEENVITENVIKENIIGETIDSEYINELSYNTRKNQF